MEFDVPFSYMSLQEQMGLRVHATKRLVGKFGGEGIHRVLLAFFWESPRHLDTHIHQSHGAEDHGGYERWEIDTKRIWPLWVEVKKKNVIGKTKRTRRLSPRASYRTGQQEVGRIDCRPTASKRGRYRSERQT